jgi:hypothetical protein
MQGMLLFWKSEIYSPFSWPLCIIQHVTSVLITMVNIRYRSTAAGKRQYMLLQNPSSAHFKNTSKNFLS